MTIGGKEVLILEPEFSAPPAIVGNREAAIATISVNKRVAQFAGKHAVHTLNQSFLFTDKEQIEDFQDFFEARAGKWGSFWVPSWTAELNPKSGIVNGGTAISITPVDYANIYLGSLELTRLGHYVFLLHVDGTLHISRVTGSADFSGLGFEVLTLETPAPQAFVLGDFIMGFCYFVRFAADTLNLEFDGPQQARAKIGMIEVILVEAYNDPLAATDPGPGTPEPWTDKDNNEWTDADGATWTN